MLYSGEQRVALPPRDLSCPSSGTACTYDHQQAASHTAEPEGTFLLAEQATWPYQSFDVASPAQ